MEKSYLEVYTKAYVKSHGRKSLSLKNLQYAVALLNEKLTSSCCNDSDAVVDYSSTKLTSSFISGFKGMLNLIPRKGNINSLTKTKNYLQSIIDGICC